MKQYQLNIKRHVRTSAMPNYMLMLSVHIINAYGNRKHVDDDIVYTLGNISYLINRFSFIERNKRKYGTTIYRKINEKSIDLYSRTGNTKLITIYFNKV